LPAALCIAGAVIAAPDVLAAPPTQQAGISSAVKGKVARASTVADTDQRQALEPGSKVYMQDRVSSDERSLAQLLLLDQSTFKLGPDSSVVIDEFIYDPEQGTGEMVVEAASGVMRFISGAIGRSDPDDVEIETPLGTLGVRGTMVTLSIRRGADGQAQEALYVLNGPGADNNALARRGAIQVSAQGETVTVQRAGWGTFVRPEQPPSPPQPIPTETLDLLGRQLAGEAPTGGGADDSGITATIKRVGVDRLSGQTTATTRASGETANQVDQVDQAVRQIASGAELEDEQLPADQVSHFQTQTISTEFGVPQTLNGLLDAGPQSVPVTQSNVPLYSVNDLENITAADAENLNFSTLTGLQLQGIDQAGSYDVVFNVDFSEKTFALDFNNISLPGEQFGNISNTGDIAETDEPAGFLASGQVGSITTIGSVQALKTDQKALSGIISALFAGTDPEVIGVRISGLNE
jgi:hypothetical protein